jgi:hypothetical protein
VQESREALSQIAFRSDQRQVEAAVQHPVNERTNNRGTVHRVAGLLPHYVNCSVKAHDLSIEQDNRYFGPFIAVKEGAPSARFYYALSRRRADAPLPTHRTDYIGEFLVAATQQWLMFAAIASFNG